MKILIATPVYNNQLDSRMVSSVLKVITECAKRNVSLDWDRPCSPILSYNRNVSAQRAIDEDFDWLLFWDADTTVDDPAFAFKAIELGYYLNAGVIGFPCRLKVPEKRWNFCIEGNKNYEDELPGNQFLVHVIGTGLMLINVKVLKVLPPPWFHIQDTYHDKPGFYPEDWTFCELAHKHEIKVIADPRFHVEHWGTYSYG